MIFAPWDDETVVKLVAWQQSRLVHPYTCGGDHSDSVNLIPTVSGWICPDITCDYHQNWAHDFDVDVLDGSMAKMLYGDSCDGR